MPSFFEGLKRLVLGKPVFTANDAKPADISSHQSQPNYAPTAAGPKVTPQLIISRAESSEQGKGMRCELVLHNYSQMHLTVDRVELLGQTKELGRIIDPAEEYELQWDFSSRPGNTMYDDCNVYYKNTDTTDAFCSYHTVEFERQSDSSYTIQRVKFLPPIRDI